MNNPIIVVEAEEFVIWQTPGPYYAPERHIFYAESKVNFGCTSYKRSEKSAVTAARKGDWHFMNNTPVDWGR